MEITVPMRHLAAVNKKLISESRSWVTEDHERFNIMDDTIANAQTIATKELEALKVLLLADVKAKVPGAVTKYNSVLRVLRYQKEPDVVNRSVSKLNDLASALKELVETTSPKRRWLFCEMGDEMFCPVYVARVEYHSGRRDKEGHVLMTLVCAGQGELTTSEVRFYKNDIRASKVESDDYAVFDFGDNGFWGDDDDEEDEQPNVKKDKVAKVGVYLTLGDVLRFRRLYVDTAERFAAYTDSLKAHAKWKDKCGLVCTSSGPGFYMRRDRYQSVYGDEKHYSSVAVTDPEGRLPSLVMDDTNTEKIKFDMPIPGWESHKRDSVSDGQFWGIRDPVMPLSPYILAFDLDRHQHVFIHADRLAERVFDDQILDKLVIPETDKHFVSMLMTSAGLKLKDIIRNKSGGVFVLSTGIPGTGKTLTAEVYAELMKLPLYSVQCSQLGIEAEHVEKHLRLALKRAERWKAVLLIDEADVYIRSRGKDIVHNAIVGVFLRVIEYYNSIIFMTSNLDDIDEAIMSRATAHLSYTPPGPLLPETWAVLSKQFEAGLTPKDIEELVGLWPGITGRDVKNLLKLARFLSHNSGEKISASSIQTIAKYHNLK